MKFSYVKVYSALLLRFGLEVFDLDKVYSELGWLGVKTPLNIIMQRLCRKGYIERVGRGKYRVVHPTILLLESLGYRWRDRVASEYRPILEYVVSRLIEYFRERLVSIVLYGSLARGEARDTSDIDLLIIAVDIPGNYSERVEQISRILDDVSRFRYRLWMEKRIYPLIDIIILDREEALDYLNRARSRLIDAESSLNRGDYPETVRYSQEAVELSLKSVLRIMGIEYPKIHDVGDILYVNKDRYPEWFREEIDNIRKLSRELALKRSPAMYGLELSGKTPSELFDKRDAEEAFKSGKYVYEMVKKVVEEYLVGNSESTT